MNQADWDLYGPDEPYRQVGSASTLNITQAPDYVPPVSNPIGFIWPPVSKKSALIIKRRAKQAASSLKRLAENNVEKNETDG